MIDSLLVVPELEAFVKCSKCGYENRAQARFCKQCGEVLSHPDTVPVMEVVPTPGQGRMVCPACGAVNDNADARYCLRCGKPLPGAEPDHPATQPAMSPSPPPPARPVARPAMPTSAGRKAATTAPTPPLPPTEPPDESRQGLPRWAVWGAVGCAGLSCLVILAAVALVGYGMVCHRAMRASAADSPLGVAVSQRRTIEITD
jgi:DNA-directed RNA polymerase subunit M/transcription elongation factor TFIIS